VPQEAGKDLEGLWFFDNRFEISHMEGIRLDEELVLKTSGH
jgi:hypothetical protein